MRRSMNWTVALAAAACLSGPGVLAQAAPMTSRTPTAQDDQKREDKEFKKQDRYDVREAKKQLDSARAILNRLAGQREAGVSREDLSQLKNQFTDLYNDYNKTGGKAVNHSGTGVGNGTTRSRGDWQEDYANLQRRLDDLGVAHGAIVGEREGTAGTSGYDEHRAATDRDRDREPSASDLQKFRLRLESFYAAASGTQPKDHDRDKR
jgi:hypothetical protein